MGTASPIKPEYFQLTRSRISSRHSHGKMLGSGGKGAINTRSVKKVELQLAGWMKAVHRVLDPNRPVDIDGDACALAVMTKAPRAGEVKTRLVPPLTHDEAAQLNSSFLRDIAAAISAAIGETALSCGRRPVDGAAGSQAATERIAHGVGVYTPQDAEAAYENILP